MGWARFVVPLLPAAAATTAAPLLSKDGVFTQWGPDNDRDWFRLNAKTYRSEWPPPPLLRLSQAGSWQPINAMDATDLGSRYPRKTDIDVAAPTAFSWESGFNGGPFLRLSRVYWFAGHSAVAMYIVGMWMGERHMRRREAFDLKGLLNAWNLILALFSLCGSLRTAPHLVAVLRTFGVEYTICRCASAAYGSGTVGLWTMLFIFSKYFELIDTVFLVLRKRKVGFLHWYHHTTVLLYCWHSYMWEIPTGLYFITINYTVHAVMYFYYFLAGVMRRPPCWGVFVTVIQIAQMVVGIVVTLTNISVLASKRVPHCDGYIWNLVFSLGMYGSYFLLFAQFFVGRYCKKHPAKQA